LAPLTRRASAGRRIVDGSMGAKSLNGLKKPREN